MLHTSIQSQSPSHIHPPRLVIEYVERKVSEISAESDSGGNIYASIVIKTEYTMKTKKFWTAVKVMSGFVSAAAFIVWLVRLYKWQVRNKRISFSVNKLPVEQRDGSTLILHAVMLMIHTFVIVFCPFIFAICAYW